MLITERKVNKTRFPELGFTQVTRGLWRFVDLSTDCEVGPHYSRKDELLADLSNYARDFGCELA